MANARSVIINFVANDRVSGAMKGIGKSFSRLTQEIGKRATVDMATVGSKAGEVFSAALAGGLALDSARSKLEAQLGLTKTQSKTVGAAAGKLFSQAYGESMEDVQGAITSVIQNMDGMRNASQSALQQMTARAMNTAAVMDEEVGGVTRAVSQMLRTGLAKNAQEAFDILVAGTQNGANKAQDLLDTFNEYGTQFRKLGLGGKQAMGLIQQGLAGGARDADLAADALKEFSIRAVDGSKTTAAGFKDLGLDAGKMAASIGKGGDIANEALDLVFDKLRGVKDPIKQSEIAVNLFGTQWEDMGAALLKMDPSSAAKSLGQIGGAADRAGKSLHDNAQAKFEAFKRTLTQGTVTALMDVVGWMQKHTTTAKVLAGVIGGAVATYVAYNLALGVMAVKTAVVTAATATWNVVTKAAKIATLAWTGAQWLLNAALSANPIGLVIAAIALLIGGIILAYKKSDTFRAIVDAVWAAVKNAVMSAWNFIKPVFEQIAHVLLVVVGTALKWYWAYVKFVFTTVWTIISTTWNLIKPIFLAIVNVVRNVLGAAWIFLQNIVKIVWIAIQIYIKIAWTLIKGYFTLIKLYITKVLIPIFLFLYNNVVKPVWAGIVQVVKWAWTGLKVVFDVIRGFLSKTLGPAFTAFKRVGGAAWTGLKVVISNVVGGIKTVWGGLKTALGKVKDAFHTAVEGIKKIWSGLKSATKTPVNFVIGLYNDGIVSLVNKIAGFAGVKTRLSKIPKFARGGVMPGYAPGRDSMLAAVSPGESIFRPEFTRAVGSDFVKQANARARSGGPKAVRKWLTGTDALGGEGIAFSRGGTAPGFAGRFALGGIVGGFVKGLKDFAFGNVEKAAKSTLGKILGGSLPGSGQFRDLVAKIPDWIKTNILKWIKDKVGFGGGPGMSKGLAFAKSQVGKPYVWGGVGPGGYDCSGFMSAITNVIHGKSPYSRLFSTHSFGASSGPGGFVRNKRSGFMVGVTDAGVGHMAGTLLGHNVESSGSRGVHMGAGARGANDGLFTRRYGLKADTGALALAPGWNPPTFNGTGRTEYLETPRAGGGDIHVHLENHGVIGSRLELQNWLTTAMVELKKRGRLP